MTLSPSKFGALLGVIMAIMPFAVDAIEFDEVRNYEDVFVISASAPGRQI